MSMGLRGRSIALCTVLLTGTTFLVGTALIRQSHEQSLQEFSNHARVHAGAIGEAIEPAVLLGNREEMLRILGSSRNDDSVICGVVIDAAGAEVCSVYSDSRDLFTIDASLIHRARAGERGPRLHATATQLQVVIPLWQSHDALDIGLEPGDPPAQSSQQPVAFLAVGYSKERLQREIQARIRTAVAVLAGVLTVAIGATVLAVRQLLRPLRELMNAVRRISEGDRATRASEQAPGEIGALANAFNQMADRVQQSYEAIERQVEERTRELVRANRAKDDFLANMSHEIRTPMTAILGFAEQLLEPELSEAARRDAVETMRRNGDHLLQIINDILDLSKIEAGKLCIERIPCRPRDLLDDVARLTLTRARQKGLAFSVHCDPAVPTVICTDPTRLRQILLNLVGNAVKFTERGEARLSAHLIRATDAGGRASRDEPPAKQLEFRVSDTGFGIPSDRLDLLFRPFTQADESMTRRFGGTGLGLAISRHLARALGGDIRVESVPGRGTTFTVTIDPGECSAKPVDATGDPQSTKLEAAPPCGLEPRALRGLRVLVAEDGPDNQRLISAVLRSAGAEVVLVADGRSAVDAALNAQTSGRPFDTILMDMQMPILDGYSAVAELRSRDYRPPIIALTAHAMSGDEARCLAAGCDAYATKPIDRGRLIALIRSECERARVATVSR